MYVRYGKETWITLVLRLAPHSRHRMPICLQEVWSCVCSTCGKKTHQQCGCGEVPVGQVGMDCWMNLRRGVELDRILSWGHLWLDHPPPTHILIRLSCIVAWFDVVMAATNLLPISKCCYFDYLLTFAFVRLDRDAHTEGSVNFSMRTPWPRSTRKTSLDLDPQQVRPRKSKLSSACHRVPSQDFNGIGSRLQEEERVKTAEYINQQSIPTTKKASPNLPRPRSRRAQKEMTCGARTNTN